MAHTPQQFAKLPTWAKSEIEVLTLRLKEAEAVLQQMGPQGDTDTVVRDHTREWRLPDGAEVRFLLGDWRYISCRFDRREGVVHMDASGTLDIEPRACNLIYARVRQ